jgi:hypothetical protein
MPSLSQDSTFYHEAAKYLADYLLSNELFWDLGGKLPRLTAGSLLLAQTRLAAWSAREVNFAQSRLTVEAVRSEWKTAWEKKARQDARARLGLWQHYLEDYFDAPISHFAGYSSEVRNRVILQLLNADLPEPLSEWQAVNGLDARLKVRLNPAPFLWEKEIESAFPLPEFWYLYQSLART